VRIDVVTLFPEVLQSLSGLGVTGRAVKEGKVVLQAWSPRDYAAGRHRNVDDRPYGGGPGMVMLVEPMRQAIRAARDADSRPVNVSLMSPQGQRLDQDAVRQLAQRDRLLLVCGRYEGIDERLVEQWVDEEWSLGDFVISGGELAAAVLIDAVTRLQPGVLGDDDSAEQDSFMDGLLDHPHYTRPEVIDGLEVPAVLLSGDHGAIRNWRRKQALGRTWLRRPDLLAKAQLTTKDEALLEEFRQEWETRRVTPGASPD